jgi:GT2 family glycosyltransferase
MNDQSVEYDIAILIVSYNVGFFIERCLKSVSEHLARERYIISIVDNASRDDSVARIKAQPLPIVLTESKVNLGFGRGINLAAQKVQARYYLVLNPDTILINDIVTQMRKGLDEKPDIAVIGCPMINEKGDIQAFSYDLPGFFITISSFFELKRLLRFHALRAFLKRTALSKAASGYLTPPKIDGSLDQVQCVPGSGFLVRASHFNKVRGFDEKIFLYMEDCDLFLRLQRQGHTVSLLNQVGIVHFVSKSFSSSYTPISPYKYWSTLYYFRKHASTLTFQLVRLALLLSSICKWMMSVTDKGKARYRLDAARVISICLFGIQSFNPFPAEK